MEGIPDKRPSDRLFPPQNVPKVMGLCPLFDQITDDDTLQGVLQLLNVSAAEFELVLVSQGVPPSQIGFVIGALTYKFALIRPQGIMSRNVRIGLDYLRKRQGLPLFDQQDSPKGPDHQSSSPSGSHRLPPKSKEVQVDKSRRLCDLGFGRDELIGGIMALGAIDTAPTMVIVFWEKPLAELEAEAGNTFSTLLRFLEKGGKSVSEIGSVEVAVRTEVGAAVARAGDLPPVTQLQIEAAVEVARAEEATRALNVALSSNPLVAAADTPATPVPRPEGDAARDAVPGGGITDTKRVSLAGDTQPVSARDFLAHMESERERRAKEQGGNA